MTGIILGCRTHRAPGDAQARLLGHEGRDVAQVHRRQVDAQLAAAQALLEIDVGGGDDSDIDRHGALAAPREHRLPVAVVDGARSRHDEVVRLPPEPPTHVGRDANVDDLVTVIGGGLGPREVKCINSILPTLPL